MNVIHKSICKINKHVDRWILSVWGKNKNKCSCPKIPIVLPLNLPLGLPIELDSGV